MLEVNIQRRVYMEGYWQSEKYFGDVADVIRKELEVIAEVGSRARDEAEMISKQNSVCLGIRIVRKTHRVGLEYYSKAVEMMSRWVPDAHYFVVCNDLEWVKQNFSISYPFTLISHKEEKERTYENLWLMSLCKHFIISESTYHWWGAWLSKNPDKRVIAPGPELAKTSPDFIPDDWVQLGAS
jgi:hypothetical protein